MRPRLRRGPSLSPTLERPSLFSRRANQATSARLPMLRPSERTAPRPPPHFAYRSCSLKTFQRRRRLALRSEGSDAGKTRAETVRGPLLPNYTLNARPLSAAAALLLRQTPLHLL